ncbi:mannonate dehydratase [Saliterribacillus persicus]|uniref:Mannonate dehydratase n=1 Tax=Saliterribacillus persicus TaxID=930114 RepID=A0A368Y4X3_9BACI|nr:mannonate dehydratase [Saliterribacillus persicus]RCW74789.1 D-mannonate dehydratase [Saliterribacillus persicus]
MNMVFRWFGEGNDSVCLEDIKQIPGVKGVVWALHDIEAGEVWPKERIDKIKQEADRLHFHLDVVESINIHESIKLGSTDRDYYIDNYIETIKNVANAGVKVICYNFMPVFDWIRTDLYKTLPDGSSAMFYEKDLIKDLDPLDLADKINENPAYTMPGWEPSRMKALKNLFEKYQSVTEEDLFQYLRYFLERVIPVCAAHDIKLALHPDDPPWEVFGLPRIATNQKNLGRILQLVDHPANGLTFCTGALGVNPNNNLVKMIEDFQKRIYFAHIRNVKNFENGDFIETSHYTKDGSIEIDAVMEMLSKVNYSGYIRPDHGRHIWNEKSRAGYGLYDRALGIMYLHGLWDAFERKKEGLKRVTN